MPFSARILGASLVLLLAGCLSDPIDRPEVKPRVINAPTGIWFRATNFQAPEHGDMALRWTHATADTQQNFKGYLVRVYTSIADSAGIADNERLGDFIASDTVFKNGNKVDTTTTFSNLAAGRYTAMVNGIQFADSLILSRDTARTAFDFDPVPLLNPTNLRANSAGPTSVRLKWDTPPTDAGRHVLGYRVYYRAPDTNRVYVLPNLLPVTSNSATVSVPGYLQTSTTSNPELSRPYLFWLKIVRNDSSEFFDDSSSVTWSGAVRIPTDTSRAFRYSVLMSGTSNQALISDDSVDNSGQLHCTINGTTLVVTTGGGALLNTRVDTALHIDSVFYTTPVTSGFTVNSYTFDNLPANSGGVVLYLQWPDEHLNNKPEYGRIFIQQQPNGSLISDNGEVRVYTSFQPGKTSDGGDHLTYY